VFTAVLFLGGWRGPGAELEGIAGQLIGFMYLFIKTMGVYFVVMLVRNTVPRLRIDHMMAFNWKFLVPLSMFNLLVVAIFSRITVPNYAATQESFNATFASWTSAGGILGWLAETLNNSTFVGMVAEFPRFVVLLIINLVMIVLLQRVLRLYVRLDQRTVKDVPHSRPVSRPLAGAVAPAEGAAGR
jgi:hypothetical protein